MVKSAVIEGKLTAFLASSTLVIMLLNPIKLKLNPNSISTWSLTLLLVFLGVKGENVFPKSGFPVTDSHSVQYESILNAETKAFLDTIAWAETGTTGAEGYKSLVFKGKFNSFATHPKIKQCALIKGRQVCSTAAGRYQMMDFNWDKLSPRLGLDDFSPASQDRMALELIRQKGAIEDVSTGQFEVAACKVGGIWASFPCNSYSQNPKSMAQLKAFYKQQLHKYR